MGMDAIAGAAAGAAHADFPGCFQAGEGSSDFVAVNILAESCADFAESGVRMAGEVVQNPGGQGAGDGRQFPGLEDFGRDEKALRPGASGGLDDSLVGQSPRPFRAPISKRGRRARRTACTAGEKKAGARGRQGRRRTRRRDG